MNKQELLHPKKLLEKLLNFFLATKDDEDCLNSRFSNANFVLLGKTLKKKMRNGAKARHKSANFCYKKTARPTFYK